MGVLLSEFLNHLKVSTQLIKVLWRTELATTKYFLDKFLFEMGIKMGRAMGSASSQI